MVTKVQIHNICWNKILIFDLSVSIIYCDRKHWYIAISIFNPRLIYLYTPFQYWYWKIDQKVQEVTFPSKPVSDDHTSGLSVCHAENSCDCCELRLAAARHKSIGQLPEFISQHSSSIKFHKAKNKIPVCNLHHKHVLKNGSSTGNSNTMNSIKQKTTSVRLGLQAGLRRKFYCLLTRGSSLGRVTNKQ